MHDANSVEQPFKVGDVVRRTDTGRVAQVINDESHFVSLVQFVDGSVDWIAHGLLERMEPVKASHR